MGEESNQWCFACGVKNPIGLKLKFKDEGETYTTVFTGGLEHQSYDGIVHGGILSTLLDEIMGGYLYHKGLNAVTARLDVRFRQPTPINIPLTVTGRIVSQKRSFYEMKGEVTLPDGTVTAEGSALMKVLEG
jgi:acyl-coenzyme A thioesterase PaaI-like protein